MCVTEHACSRVCTEAMADGYWLICYQCCGVEGQPKSTAFTSLQSEIGTRRTRSS